MRSATLIWLSVPFIDSIPPLAILPTVFLRFTILPRPGLIMMSRAFLFSLPVCILMMGFSALCLAKAKLPVGFVDLAEVVPTVVIDLRYVSKDNFVGQPVEGYMQSRCILTSEAASALKKVHDDLARYGLGLKVFDAYRPQRAVDHFVRWSKDDADQKTKQAFYPNVAKQELFKAGYIAARSSHSRGSTVDLTIVSLAQGEDREELDMGTPFDFFGHQSWVDSSQVTSQQRANRLLLRELMIKHGFRPYDKEWWHFTLLDEPFPETYFDFPVK